ncbi:MAG: ribosomal protein S18-alanine N-acetyltransferase [Firmicutes bacterium]|nr:ribosomal protein S18-alanine N-acetyltransferase [Bacillota bacterium]
MIIIRQMVEDDLDQIMRIEEESFSSPWSRQSMEQELAGDQAHYFTACDEQGEVIGYAGFWQVMDEGHIMNIAVRKDRQRKGIGQSLMEAMLSCGDALGILYWTLEVRVSNLPAVRLYEKIGFTSAGIRPGYYQHPREDANILWLTRSI